MELPIVNKEYNYFDDGKINESRKFKTIITKITPFKLAKEEDLDYWISEVKQLPGLYEPKTEFFIEADLYLEGETRKIIFVQSKRFGWFSLGWWAGALDIDGSLTATSLTTK